eukprot:6294550-Heterocapsa_arctica.AAC.1
MKSVVDRPAEERRLSGLGRERASSLRLWSWGVRASGQLEDCRCQAELFRLGGCRKTSWEGPKSLLDWHIMFYVVTFSDAPPAAASAISSS